MLFARKADEVLHREYELTFDFKQEKVERYPRRLVKLGRVAEYVVQLAVGVYATRLINTL